MRANQITPENIAIALENADYFHELFTGVVEFVFAASYYQNTAEPLKNYLLTHEADFHIIINSQASLRHFAEELPQYSDEIIRFVLTHPDEFKRLIVKQGDYRQMLQAFPKYHLIFNQTDPNKGLCAVKKLCKSVIEIKQATRMLRAGSTQPDSTLYNMPPEILIRIASFVGNRHDLSALDAFDIAYERMSSLAR
jgi:hypothetical protein